MVPVIEQREGYRRNLMGVDCYVHKDDESGMYVVTEKQTGGQISHGYTRKEAILSAKERLKNNPDAVEKGKKIFKDLGGIYPSK